MRRKGMTVERVRAFAHAARDFWRAKPWTLAEGETLWSIEPRPKLKPMRHVTVMGGGGEEFGLAFLDNPDRMRQMIESDTPSTYFEAAPTTHWSVGLECREDAPPADVALWASERLALASDEAFPVPIGVTPAGRASRPTPEMLTQMEGLLRVFAKVGKREFERDTITMTVPTFGGDVGFVLHAALRTREHGLLEQGRCVAILRPWAAGIVEGGRVGHEGAVIWKACGVSEMATCQRRGWSGRTCIWQPDVCRPN